MNQLVYNQILEKNSSLYLSSIKSINNTKVKDEFKQYRKNSLYYLIKLNLERNKDQQSVEYKIFQFLDKNLDNILIGDVSKLIELNEQFSRLLLINYDYRFPEGKYSFCLLAEKLKIGEYSLYIKYYDTNDNDKPELLTLKSVFQNFLFKYSLLNSNNKKKHIISSIENRLCPFCSRNYINLIEGVTHNMGINLDHFYSQNDYPLLSISFFNLIPCCQPCNSAFKGEKKLNETYIHPSQDSLDSAKFTLNFLHKKKNFRVLYFLDDTSFEIGYTRNISKDFNEDYYNKFKKSAGFFKIQNIYNAHKDVVKGTLIDYYVYQEGEVLNSIQKTFPMLNLQYKALGIGSNKEDWFYVPFGKLKYDILSELLKSKVSYHTNYRELFKTKK